LPLDESRIFSLGIFEDITSLQLEWQDSHIGNLIRCHPGSILDHKSLSSHAGNGPGLLIAERHHHVKKTSVFFSSFSITVAAVLSALKSPWQRGKV
jgi:hypothetical protein